MTYAKVLSSSVPVKRTTLPVIIVLSSALLFLATPYLTVNLGSTPALPPPPPPPPPPLYLPCPLEIPVKVYRPLDLTTNSTTPPPPAIVPSGRGSRAAPGFNFRGVCGKQDFKCVISYVIYGNQPKYMVGALRNAMLAKDVYPGWIPRYYYENTVPRDILQKLKELGAELINVSTMNGITGMTARFLVAEDDTVDRYIIRDTDSRLNLREKAAVEEWIESGYSVHILRDHPNHILMNGGMWGGVKGAVRDLTTTMHKINMDFVTYNADQDFLGKYVFPQIEKDHIAHDSANCELYPNSFGFPTNRIGYEHVGQVFSERDEPRWGDIDCCLLNFEAPVKCRRRLEWTKG